MTHTPLVFLDIETTGSSARFSRVLEIGALRVEDGKVVQTYSQLIDPEEYVPSFITGITGITNDDVYGKPRFAHIAQDLEQLLHGAVFVAHNVNFDYSFIKMEYERMGMAFNHDRMCTVRLSRALYPHERSHRLDAVIARHGFTVANRHRAYDDAEILYKFFIEAQKQFDLEVFRHMNRLITYARH